MDGYLKLIRQKHPELADTALVYVLDAGLPGRLPGRLEQGGHGASWRRCASPVPKHRLAGQCAARLPPDPGGHRGVREIVESFGLDPIIAPDLSGSLDGHIPETFLPTTLGGTTRGRDPQHGRLGRRPSPSASRCGPPRRRCEARTGVPLPAVRPAHRAGSQRRVPGISWPNCQARRFRANTAASAASWWTPCWTAISSSAARRSPSAPSPTCSGRWRSWLAEMGCEIAAAVTTTQSPLLEKMPAEEVLIGDLEDLEKRAAGCDLLITHSHGRQAAERLGIPFFRMGLPLFDRLGAAHQLSVGYRGTRDLVFEVGNLFIENLHQPRGHARSRGRCRATKRGTAAAEHETRRRLKLVNNYQRSEQHESRLCDPGHAACRRPFRLGQEYRGLRDFARRATTSSRPSSSTAISRKTATRTSSPPRSTPSATAPSLRGRHRRLGGGAGGGGKDPSDQGDGRPEMITDCSTSCRRC